MVYRHTAYSSPARRKSQSEEIISGETNERMHSNSARDLMFYETNLRTKTKILVYTKKKKKKKKTLNKNLVGVRSHVDGSVTNAQSTRQSQTTRYLKRLTIYIINDLVP